MADVTITLEGELGSMSALGLAGALDAMAHMLMSVGADSSDVTLAGLAEGSAVALLHAPDESVETILGGLETLTCAASMPQGWNSRTLIHAQNLVNASHHKGIDSVSVGATSRRVHIADTIKENAQRVQITPLSSIGSVTGVLYAYNNRDDDLTCRMINEKTGLTVQLILESSMAETAKKMLDTRVRAWGKLERDRSTHTITSLTVTDIEPTPPSASVPVSTVVGVLGHDFLDGTDAVAVVRQLRDA